MDSRAFLGLRPPASLVDGAIGHEFGLRPAVLVMAAPSAIVAGALAVIGRRRPLTPSTPSKRL